jgi:two-component system LytT family response regulator
MSIRALLVDDERPARRKIARFLEAEPDFEIVGECADGAEAVEAVARLHPDVVFMEMTSASTKCLIGCGRGVRRRTSK